MTANTNYNQDKIKPNDTNLDMKTIEKDLGKTGKLIENLAGCIRQLPKVDEKGRSECWFAEDLYAYKEKAARVVKIALEVLREYISPVKNEIRRCRKNLMQIRLDDSELHNVEAKKKYDRAKELQLLEIDKAEKRRKWLSEVIHKGERELIKAAEKRWPLGEPKAADNFNPEAVLKDVMSAKGAGLSFHDYVRQSPAHHSSTKEINSLISVGPIGGKLFS
jgi:hypothetical protein